MSKNAVVERYTNALIGTLDTSEIEDALQELLTIFAYISDNEKVYNFFKSPIVEVSKKIEIGRQIVQSNSKNNKITRFIDLIIKKNRLQFSSVFSRQIEKKLDDLRNIVRAQLYVNKKLSPTIESNIISSFQKNSKKILKYETIEDPEIIGGFKLKIGDIVYDATINNTLNAVKQTILKS